MNYTKKIKCLGFVNLEKYRISTTISPKHYAILKKYAERYGTHQSVLEHAMEVLDQNPPQGTTPSREEELWIRMGRELGTSLTVIQVDSFKAITETVDFDQFNEYIAKYKPVEFVIEFIYGKPLKKCSMPELIDGLILNIKMQKTYDTISYADEGDSYMLSLTHNLGLGASKMLSIMHDSVFNSYGVKAESHVSERSIFTRIYKRAEGLHDPGDKFAGTKNGKRTGCETNGVPGGRS